MKLHLSFGLLILFSVIYYVFQSTKTNIILVTNFDHNNVSHVNILMHILFFELTNSKIFESKFKEIVLEYKIENDNLDQSKNFFKKINKLLTISLNNFHSKYKENISSLNFLVCKKHKRFPEKFRYILIQNSKFVIKNEYIKNNQTDSKNNYFYRLLAYKCFFRFLINADNCYDCFCKAYFAVFFNDIVLFQNKMQMVYKKSELNIIPSKALNVNIDFNLKQQNVVLNALAKIYDFLSFSKKKIMLVRYYNPLFVSFIHEKNIFEINYKALFTNIINNYHFERNKVEKNDKEIFKVYDIKIIEVYTKQKEITEFLQFFYFMYPINHFLILSSTILYFNDKYINAIEKIEKYRKREINLYNNLNTDSKNIFICFDILFEENNLFFQNENSLLCNFFLKTYENQENYDILDHVNNSTNNFKNLHIIFEVGGTGSAERLKSNLYFHYLSKKIFEKNKSLVLERYDKIYKKYRKPEKLKIFCHDILRSFLDIGFDGKGDTNRFLNIFFAECESNNIYKEYVQKIMDILSDSNECNNKTQCFKIERIYGESLKIYFDFLVENDKYSGLTLLFYFTENFFNINDDEKDIFYVYLPFYENIESIFNFLNFKNYDFIYENVKITFKFDSGFFLYNQNKKPETENCFCEKIIDFKNFYFTFYLKSFKDEILFNVKTILNYYIFLYENQIKDYDFGNLKEAFNNFLKDIKKFSSNGLSNIKLENEFKKLISQDNYLSLIEENNKFNNQNIITNPKIVIKSIQNVPLLLNNSSYVPTHNLVLNHQKGKKGKKPNPNLIEKKEKEKKRLKNK